MKKSLLKQLIKEIILTELSPETIASAQNKARQNAERDTKKKYPNMMKKQTSKDEDEELVDHDHDYDIDLTIPAAKSLVSKLKTEKLTYIQALKK